MQLHPDQREALESPVTVVKKVEQAAQYPVRKMLLLLLLLLVFGCSVVAVVVVVCLQHIMKRCHWKLYPIARNMVNI